MQRGGEKCESYDKAKSPGREARRSAGNAKAQRRALRHGGGRRSRPLHPPSTNREDKNSEQ